MNLIEQLGGYEKARQVVKKIDIRSIKYKALKKALLEYRRQHNIYEEGDLVVIPSRGNGLFSVSRLLCLSDRCEMRHATDEEIKTGKRLEVESEN
ncbi:hypothetical protein [Acinetobacter variabilis]|uniref:hypothetical protein n=1 Tax=Acinetobacter variabilis TaxID=70346 RepID=UPI001BB714C0|nr:hypothetical protein [Acinetobacter variabilis]BCT88937.1 hypothetical protein RYU24_13420 [Acinetobacter variabilis]